MSDKKVSENLSFAAVVVQAIENAFKDLHTTMPGTIQSFDPATQIASVQLGIKRVFKKEDEEGNEQKRYEALPKLINVPVIFPRGGGFTLTFPVKKGDECIVIFNERSIDNWNKNGGVQNPGAWRMHDLSDAVCMVGLSSQPNKISGFDANNVQLRNDTGDSYVTIKTDKTIEIVSPTEVIVDAPDSTFTGNVQIDGDMNVTGDVTGESNATFAVGIVSALTVDATSSLIVNSLEMGDHIHAQPVDGSGDSEADTNGPKAP